jgi:SAM-dependent methyltransferase
MTPYDPETYWSNVGQKIQQRGQSNYLAGNDDPFCRYQRHKFLTQFLDSVDFCDKRVLEIGCGPGGNLDHIAKRCAPQELLGADISQTMIDIAAENLAYHEGTIGLYKIDGKTLPFEAQSVDVSIAVTVLQHVIDEDALESLATEICRVSKTEIIIIEDTGNNRELGVEGTYVRRQIDNYKLLFAEHGFALCNVSFLNTRISRLWSGLVVQKIYKRFINKRYTEGDATDAAFKLAVGLPLFFTRYLDEIFVGGADLTKMSFRRL